MFRAFEAFSTFRWRPNSPLFLSAPPISQIKSFMMKSIVALYGEVTAFGGSNLDEGVVVGRRLQPITGKP